LGLKRKPDTKIRGNRSDNLSFSKVNWLNRGKFVRVAREKKHKRRQESIPAEGLGRAFIFKKRGERASDVAGKKYENRRRKRDWKPEKREWNMGVSPSDLRL